jgi:hypothetical protein
MSKTTHRHSAAEQTSDHSSAKTAGPLYCPLARAGLKRPQLPAPDDSDNAGDDDESPASNEHRGQRSTLSPSGLKTRGSFKNAGTDRVDSEEETLVDPYDHHVGSSSAATNFHPRDVDDPSRRRVFERLKGWNDGTRDSNRQSWEGSRDKQVWTKTYGHRLELPQYVVGNAQNLLSDLGDVRRLGHYNDLYLAVLASLAEAYHRHWLRRRYAMAENSVTQSWSDRGDFIRLAEEIGYDKGDLRQTKKLLGRKT